jgi:hypothetical protein
LIILFVSVFWTVRKYSPATPFADREITRFIVCECRELPKAIEKALLKEETSKDPSEASEAVGQYLTDAFIRVNNTLEKDRSIDSSVSSLLVRTEYYRCHSRVSALVWPEAGGGGRKSKSGMHTS